MICYYGASMTSMRSLSCHEKNGTSITSVTSYHKHNKHNTRKKLIYHNCNLGYVHYMHDILTYI
ncbi:hypothetical protein GLOIN_2v1493271 [Rhizophagus irregularis DAOM 181602=DAOM 197198]|uniref:Uncharacterized protein n=1 Tax=Rhizophagus irregularis (strain DAOM 181602 / DAOM 197198 / MUCL 43194) TaxID=747089 RepID=A0A2P4QYR1_RHIID|nr:hypothetical protein GLOIN_2v1493271 [Rhizophagus irregularis DAOM 181602=DAOM 197198]POG82732.1 hypothetical protein GLOIN_2v1493271 [Rhizophagus irregularis DAOM 181602=DAOM 197198]|eukprot:XP_025189598.1 hypothetical protein GLOIN_2v1493271 [Rhizophagus irregularis DAOM 181602=DAOM 197198]